MANTLKAIREEYYTPHYLCKCEYCNEDIVVSQKDFDNFFGIPKHEEHESAWKCPVCGHVNIENTNKDIWKKRCEMDGSVNQRFELTDNETKAAKEFRKLHNHKEDFKKQDKIAFSTLGMQFTYEITPGGLGNEVVIKCNECGETKDITDSENW